MKLIMNCTAVLMVVVLLSCSESPNKESANDSLQVQNIELETPLKQEERFKTVTANSNTADSVANHDPVVLQAGQPTPTIDWDKKIIKTANVTLELTDYNAYNTSLHKNLKRYGGYIAGEEQTENDARIENDLTIKVPVEQFEELMNSLPGAGVKVLEKRISTEDVTGEVVDTKARMDAKKQARAKYIDFLKQAKNMEEVLQVQNEINSIQEDIESGTGRVSYLVNQSAYSTVHLKYYQYLNGTTTIDETPSFFTKLKEALANGGSIVSGFLILMATLWPVLLAAVVAWFIFKKLRFAKQNEAQKNVVKAP